LLLFAVLIAGVQGFAGPVWNAPPEVRIVSKSFTGSVILGDVVALLVQNTGALPVHRQGLGCTRVLWNTLVRGEINIYPEYARRSWPVETLAVRMRSGRHLSGTGFV
jgi:glycine betaine/choline ABC-type transport system substrate-binding protein